MAAEFAGNAVKVVIGAFVAIQLTGLVILSIVQFPNPGALNSLDGIGQNHGTLLTGFFLNLALLQPEVTLGHLILGLIAGPAQFHTLLERGRLVVNEVDGALAGTQNVLSSVGRIAAGQQHGIKALSGNIVGLHQTVRTEGGGAILAQGADDYSGHGEKQGCLIEVVYHTQVFKAGHGNSSSCGLWKPSPARLNTSR